MNEGVKLTKASPYAIGSDHLPGLSKLIEEAGELGQAAGKILGLGHMGEHWDGTVLSERLQEEAGDLLAAVQFFALTNHLDIAAIDARRQRKLALFQKWHQEQAGPAGRAALNPESKP